MNHIIGAICALLGLAAIGYGLWQIHPPSAWIFCGVYFLAIAYSCRDTPTKAKP